LILNNIHPKTSPGTPFAYSDQIQAPHEAESAGFKFGTGGNFAEQAIVFKEKYHECTA
jgi:hypothetical protein